MLYQPILPLQQVDSQPCSFYTLLRAKKKELNSSGLTAGAHELQLLPPCFFFRPSFVKHILIQSLTFQIVSAALGGREKKKKQQHLLIHCCPLSGRDNLAAQQQNMTFGHLILLRTLWCKLGWRNINHLTRASRAGAAYTWKQKQCFSGSKQA